MEMTFQQYIDNPLGKKNAVFSQRDMYKALYTDKFNKVLLREAGKIDYTLYADKKRDRYVIHIKVPSETVKGFYYDAVILFYTNDPVIKASPSLQGYNVKFFSNDPAFVYTYLRVFLKNDIFFEELKSKAPNLALRKDPKEKNPYGLPGYSKILYFVYLYMKMKNLFDKYYFTTYAQEYSTTELLKHVEHASKKIADREEQGKIQARQRSAEKKAEQKEKHKTRIDSIQSPSGNIKATKSVKTTKVVSPVKRTATSKISKTVKKK